MKHFLIIINFYLIIHSFTECTFIHHCVNYQENCLNNTTVFHNFYKNTYVCAHNIYYILNI